MPEKVVNKDRMRGLGRKDSGVHRRKNSGDFIVPEEPRSTMDEAVLSPEYDALRQVQERIKNLRVSH